MNKKEQEDRIIQEFREAKARIRQEIQDLESEESHLFRIMLDQLKNLEEHHHSYTTYVGSEHPRSLD